MRNRDGFTLLEVLIALVILAIAASGLMSATGQSLRQANRLETKTLAGWIAENRMAEIRAPRAWPEIGTGRDHVTMGGREWDVQVAIEETPEPDMRKIEIEVFAAADKAPAATLIGFLGRH